MAKANHLEIYKHLKKTNCRECGVPTCMAFALALVNGEKTFSDCPYLDGAIANDLDEKIVRRDRESLMI